MSISGITSVFDVSIKYDGRIGELSFRDADLARSQAMLSGKFTEEITLASPDMPQVDVPSYRPEPDRGAAGCSIDIEV